MQPLAEPPALDRALISEYEDRLRAQGVPLAAWPPSALPPSVQEEIVREIGLELPAEAREWWSWHDGCPGFAA
jgi:hypothetical protein